MKDLGARMAKKRQFSESQLSDPLEPPSLIKRVGSGVVSGLSAIGNLLDTPGSMVRDVLAGENPFDQLASPLSSLNRTSGRDLLRKHGLIGSQDTYGNFFGGLGAEIALDPTLPFTGFLKACWMILAEWPLRRLARLLAPLVAERLYIS